MANRNEKLIIGDDDIGTYAFIPNIVATPFDWHPNHVGNEVGSNHPFFTTPPQQNKNKNKVYPINGKSYDDDGSIFPLPRGSEQFNNKNFGWEPNPDNLKPPDW
jgi:hypothetical protein